MTNGARSKDKWVETSGSNQYFYQERYR